MMDFVLKMMDFVLKMMDFVLKTMDFVFKMMNFTKRLARPTQSSRTRRRSSVTIAGFRRWVLESFEAQNPD